jgi:hypothetical protein
MRQLQNQLGRLFAVAESEAFPTSEGAQNESYYRVTRLQ